MDLDSFVPDPPIRCRSHRIGCIGAGFIMAEVQLPAYRAAGFSVAAIASRSKARALAVAERWDIATVHDSPEALIDDAQVEILDLAFPPHQQPALLRRAFKQPHIKGILAQKPLALDYSEARTLAAEAEWSGKTVSVNQNMRYDQSMRVLKQILDREELGDPVLATIEMRAVPHWQPFLRDYDRLTLAAMSIHHLDVLRFLFGEPVDIYTAARSDPRTHVPHRDGITVSTLRFPSGLMAVSMEDVWAGPSEGGFESDCFIRWRVEGTMGVAQGTIGWPDYPNGSPSTLRYASSLTTQGRWVVPQWLTCWFPDAFAGVMEQLQWAVQTGTPPALSIADNLGTMALVEAAYRSLEERRAIDVRDVLDGGSEQA